MGNIIDLKSYKKEYKNELENVKSWLDFHEEDIFNFMVQLANKGKWKEWSDKVKENDNFYFDIEMLQNTGDENVNLLMDLYNKVLEVKEKMK